VIPIIFDPVMVATSGAVLADAETIAAFARLMAVATVVTPNLPELAALGGRDAVLAYGCYLAEKGGHAESTEIVDTLRAPAGLVREIRNPRIETTSTHGTGCTFATALATGLGAGLPIGDAFDRAVSFVRMALLAAPGLGNGHGPLGHQFVTDFR
jgi:hydroxymethylpyrimidine/phosphomethylpyrimidine kinase